MKNSDLTPEAVDGMPHKELPPRIIILPCRKGHFYDPDQQLTTFGVESVDSQGTTWTIKENRDGVYKCRPLVAVTRRKS